MMELWPVSRLAQLGRTIRSLERLLSVRRFIDLSGGRKLAWQLWPTCWRRCDQVRGSLKASL